MTYATLEDLNEELAPATAPPTAERTLRRAGRIIDEMLIGALYETDEEGMPVDDDLLDIFAEAQVAQAIYMIETGDETGAKAIYSSISEGGISLSRDSKVKNARFAPEAVSILRVVGILPISVDSVGYGYW